MKNIINKAINIPGVKLLYQIYEKHKEPLLYLFFGGTSFFLNIILYYIFFNACKLNVLIANIIAWVIVVAYCFVTNKLWVFDNKTESKQSLATQLLSFYLSRILTLCVEELILFVFVEKIHYNDLIIKLIAQIIVIITNYILSKFIVFRKGKANET